MVPFPHHTTSSRPEVKGLSVVRGLAYSSALSPGHIAEARGALSVARHACRSASSERLDHRHCTWWNLCCKTRHRAPPAPVEGRPGLDERQSVRPLFRSGDEHSWRTEAFLGMAEKIPPPPSRPRRLR